MSGPPNRLLRIAKIGAVVGVLTGIVRRLRGRATPAVTGQANWQPLADTATSHERTGPVKFTETPQPVSDEPRWVEPVDGTCPASHPIKGNADSGIFHVPGGMSYERTVPERCYATEPDAEAGGFRRAKR